MSIIDELGGKVENQGKTPTGKVSAAEWNKLITAVDGAQGRADHAVDCADQAYQYASMANTKAVNAQGAAENAQQSANNAQAAANNALTAAITAQTTANNVSSEAVKSISVNGGEPVKPDGTGRVDLTVAVSDGRKVGYQVIPQAKQNDGFFHVWGFASLEDYETYISNPDAHADLLLYDNQIPISTDKGTSFSARLVSSSKTSNPIVATEQKYEVGLRYSGIMNDNGVLSNAGVMGTLTFQRSTNAGVTWQTVGTESIVSRDESEEVFDTYDIGKYFSTTNPQQIRVRVAFSVYDDAGNLISSAQSGWITWSNIVYTTLSVENMADWSRPILASDGVFPLSFAVLGEVDKYLHVTISGSLGTYTYVEMIGKESQYPTTSPRQWTEIERTSIGILTHGVHTVTAWLTCDDGSGSLGTDGYPNGITSDVVVNRFMVVNAATEGADLTKPYLMVQEVESDVMNYVRTTLTSYAVWVPSTENPEVASEDSIEVAVRLTDAADNDTDYSIEYMAMNVMAKSLTKYDVDGTVEIEASTGSTQPTSYLAYLRFFRVTSEGLTNFLFDSIRSKFFPINVDNSEGFSPVAGAWFVLNPKNRSNSEVNPWRIVNQATGKEVESSFRGFGGKIDGWVQDGDGRKVLRVLAGQELTIGAEVFSQMLTDARAKLTLDMVFAVRNITQEDEPIFEVCQDVSTTSAEGVTTNEQLGLRLYPLEGNIKCAGRQTDEDQNFAWEENRPCHLTLVIDPEVVTKADDELTWQKTLNNNPSVPLALAKVYIDGQPEREVDYTAALGAWITGDGHGGIRIYNPHADFDLYGLYCYRSALSAAGVRQNNIAMLPTAEEKRAFKLRNDITTNGRIDRAKAVAAGYRALTLVGQDQYKLNQDKNGYPCYWLIQHDNPALSGTIGKAAYLAYTEGKIGDAKPLMVTPQGSTANTYWDNNEQTKVDGITYRLTILFSKLHADFGWSASLSTGEDCANPMYLDGERIEASAYDTLTDEQKKRVRIEVTDGWFDGDGWSATDTECGMYHGQFYTCYEGGAKCTKLVNKINVASPMQSHKMGATRAYHDVMMQVTGGMQLHKDNPGVRFAVYEESFLFFNENPADNGKVEYRGLCTFGSGKFDKQVFGYTQDKRTFGFEGLNNNLPLCDFRVPADEEVVYNPDDESWVYNGVKSFEYGLGATKKVNGQKYPTDANDAIFRRFVNFFYCHTPRIEHFNGTKEQFLLRWQQLEEQAKTDAEVANTVADMKTYQYWFTQGSSAFNLVRWNFVTSEWVDAGTWNSSDLSYSAGVRNLSTDSMTKAAYEAWTTSSDYGDFVNLGVRFKAAIAFSLQMHAGKIVHVPSMLTHYNLVNFFLAGTDNCSKNTYYQYDPVTGLIFFCQDDLDTILVTDNNGRQTKRYFIDRIHDMLDYINGHKPHTDYEGQASALFDGIENAYETNGSELRSNMRQVLTAMCALVKTTDPWDVSVCGFFEKYFFSIQEYFPEVAYAEQARLRYEWPKSFGYISFGNQARGIDPITQQIGARLSAERQYMKRRIALVASYACWGDFSSGVNTGVVGLEDSGSALSLSPGSGNIGSEYAFDVVPHQWLYPTGAKDRVAVDPHMRVAPGESYRLVVAKSGEISGDSSVSLAALNYYRKIGNLGGMTVGNKTLAVGANRLTEFIAEPNGNALFGPNNIALNTPNLSVLSLYGCTGQIGTRDFSSLTRLSSVNLGGTSISQVSLPESSLLSSLRVPSTITKLNLEYLSALSSLDVEGYGNLAELSYDGNSPFDDENLVKQIFLSSERVLHTLRASHIAWSGTTSAMVTWLLGLTVCELSGVISLSEGEVVSYEQVVSLIHRYGDIQSESNPLCVNYRKYPINTISVEGEKYIRQTGLWNGWSVVVTPTKGNNVAIVGGREAVTYSITGDGLSSFAEVTDSVSGEVNVKQVEISKFPRKFTLRVEMQLTDGSTVAYEKSVGFARRIPRLGDIAYADGSFDDEYDSGMEIVGVVVKSDVATWADEERGIPATMDMEVYAKEDVPFKSSDGFMNSSSAVWGLYPSSDNSQGFSSDIEAEIKEATGLTSAIDIPTMPNVTVSGIPHPTTSGNYNYNYVGDSFIDDATEDGYAMLGAGAANDMDGKGNTSKIITHANKVIGLYLSENYPTSLTELCDRMVDLRNRMEAEGASSPARYYQMYWPAAYGCYLYEPKLLYPNKLAERYKKYNWSLPSFGMLCRIYNLALNSSGRVSLSNGGKISADYANETPDTEAMTPLFSNLMARLGSDSAKFAMPSASGNWSSSESYENNAWLVSFSSGNAMNSYKYNSGVVRASAAFTYEL